MAYTKNPHMPKVRREAAQMVYKGFTATEVGRRYGVGSSTICKWVKKATMYGYHPIPTLSSRPKHHLRQLSDDKVDRIVEVRLRTTDAVRWCMRHWYKKESMSRCHQLNEHWSVITSSRREACGKDSTLMWNVRMSLIQAI